MPFLCLIYITHFHMLIFTCCSLHENKHVISHCSYNRGVFLSSFNPKISLKINFIFSLYLHIVSQLTSGKYVLYRLRMYQVGFISLCNRLYQIFSSRQFSNVGTFKYKKQLRCHCSFFQKLLAKILQRCHVFGVAIEFLGNSKVHYSQFNYVPHI